MKLCSKHPLRWCYQKIKNPHVITIWRSLSFSLSLTSQFGWQAAEFIVHFWLHYINWLHLMLWNRLSCMMLYSVFTAPLAVYFWHCSLPVPQKCCQSIPFILVYTLSVNYTDKLPLWSVSAATILVLHLHKTLYVLWSELEKIKEKLTKLFKKCCLLIPW